MKNIQHLQDIANEQNWLVFAQNLRAAMSSFKEFGCSNQNEILTKVAAMQGKDPASLQNPLRAERWIADHAPYVSSGNTRQIAMTNVLLLKQIHSLNVKMAERYSPRVFDSDIGRGELKKILEQTKRAEGAPGPIGHERWQRARNFFYMAEGFISENLSRFVDRPNPALRARCKDASLPCDLEIWSEGKPVAAIEIKVARQKSTRSNRAEILGLASLLSNEFPEVILVFSHGPTKPLKEIVKLRDELSLTKVRIATLDENLCQKNAREALRFW